MGQAKKRGRLISACHMPPATRRTGISAHRQLPAKVQMLKRPHAIQFVLRSLLACVPSLLADGEAARQDMAHQLTADVDLSGAMLPRQMRDGLARMPIRPRPMENARPLARELPAANVRRPRPRTSRTFCPSVQKPPTSRPQYPPPQMSYSRRHHRHRCRET